MMRLIGLIGVLITLPIAAPAKDAAPKLKAVLSANRTTAREELTRNLAFTFSLKNSSAQAVDPLPFVMSSRLSINGQEIKEWRPALDVMAWFYGEFETGVYQSNGKSRPLDPGHSRSFTMKLGEHFPRAGTYAVHWRGKGFTAAPLSIRVLPWREKAPIFVKLTQEIRAQLPDGWQVFIEPSTQWLGEYPRTYIDVIRKAPVKVSRLIMPNEGWDDHSGNEEEEFDLEFVIEPYLSTQEYSRREAKNKGITKQLGELYDSMQDIRHKFDSFLPNTPEEKERVAHYEVLRNSLYDLPEYSYRNTALSWFAPINYYYTHSSGAESYYRRVLDKGARRECYEVTQRVLSLLTRYEPIQEQPYDDGEDDE